VLSSSTRRKWSRARSAQDDRSSRKFEAIAIGKVRSFDVIWANEGLQFPCVQLETIEGYQAHLDEYNYIERTLRMQNPLPNKLVQYYSTYPAQTLDEASYPNLGCELLKRRNADQVVTKEWLSSAKKYPNVDPRRAPILIVPQIWFWQINMTVVSAWPLGGRSGGTLSLEETDSIAKCLPIPGADPYNLILQVILDKIQSFGNPRFKDSLMYPAVLDAFEDHLATVLALVEGNVDCVYPKAALDIQQDFEFLHNISDIRHEIAMIQKIFDQQQHIVEELKNQLTHHTELTNLQLMALSRADQALGLLGRYRERTENIETKAQIIQYEIQDKLTLKRTFATMQDTHNTVLLGSAVIGLTVITIIFTPLAFVTGLLDLPLDIFSKIQYRQGDQTVFRLKPVVQIFGESHSP